MCTEDSNTLLFIMFARIQTSLGLQITFSQAMGSCNYMVQMRCMTSETI